MLATSDPASSSVTATAVIFRPATMSGIQRFSCASLAKFCRWGGHSGMDQNRNGEAAEGGLAQLLRQYGAGDGVHLAAAQFGAIADAEKAQLAHAAQHLARHFAVLFPLLRLRLDLFVDEAAQLVAEHHMFFADIGAFGGRLRNWTVAYDYFGFDVRRLTAHQSGQRPGGTAC